MKLWHITDKHGLEYLTTADNPVKLTDNLSDMWRSPVLINLATSSFSIHSEPIGKFRRVNIDDLPELLGTGVELIPMGSPIVGSRI